jgi:hypothetical protein
MALDTLSTSFVSIALMTNQTYPNVTISDFGVHVAKSQPHTNALVTSLMPIIPADDRLQWEAYAALNNSKLKSWLGNALHYQEKYDQYYGPKQNETSWFADGAISHEIRDGYGPMPYNGSWSNRSRVYTPVWHSFPLTNPATINFGTFNNFRYYNNIVSDSSRMFGLVLLQYLTNVPC